MKSIAKERHYDSDRVFQEGIKAALDEIPCRLCPPQYWNNKELADAFDRGFVAGAARKARMEEILLSTRQLMPQHMPKPT